MTSARLCGQELLQVADTVARDKGLDREEVVVALENALQKVGRTRYGQDYDILASIDRKSGEVSLFQRFTIVDEVQNPYTEISVEEACQRGQTDAKADEILTQELPLPDLGRVSAQVARQVIVQKMRDAEREKQYEEFKDRVGDVVSGAVKRAEFGSVTLDLGRTEAAIRRDQLLPRETFRVGDRVRAYIVEVRREERGPQIFLSRTHSQFMVKLFTQEVPEIYDHLVEIKAIARDPGSRAKMAVYARDPGIDPVGACVGVRGSRVQAVVQELQGEKVDIIPWSPDTATFLVNALAPAAVSKVVLDEEARRVEAVVPDDQLSLAIGRRGQNVRLASQLTGWAIDIRTENEDSEQRKAEYRNQSIVFMEALDCDEMMAHLLVSEGFSSPEELSFTPLVELSSVEGLDAEVAQELQRRAQEYVEKKTAEVSERLLSMGVSRELVELDGLALDMVATLAEQGVRTLDDLGDFSTDELVEALSAYEFRPEEAQAVIMAARAHWFKD